VSFILLTRNPRSKKLIAIVDDDGETVAEFKSESEALDAAGNTMACKAWGYDVIEVPTPTD